MEKALEREEGRTRGEKEKESIGVSPDIGGLIINLVDTPVEASRNRATFRRMNQRWRFFVPFYFFHPSLFPLSLPALSKRNARSSPPFFTNTPFQIVSLRFRPIFRVDGATHHLEYLRVVIAYPLPITIVSKVSIKGIVHKFRVETSICLSLFLFVATRIGILYSRGMLP